MHQLTYYRCTKTYNIISQKPGCTGNVLHVGVQTPNSLLQDPRAAIQEVSICISACACCSCCWGSPSSMTPAGPRMTLPPLPKVGNCLMQLLLKESKLHDNCRANNDTPSKLYASSTRPCKQVHHAAAALLPHTNTHLLLYCKSCCQPTQGTLLPSNPSSVTALFPSGSTNK